MFPDLFKVCTAHKGLSDSGGSLFARADSIFEVVLDHYT